MLAKQIILSTSLVYPQRMMINNIDGETHVNANSDTRCWSKWPRTT